VSDEVSAGEAKERASIRCCSELMLRNMCMHRDISGSKHLASKAAKASSGDSWKKKSTLLSDILIKPPRMSFALKT
jgi:hypothetical protein